MSVYLSLLGQQHNKTLNNFFLHVLNHVLKRFLIDVLIDFINLLNFIHFFSKNKLFESNAAESWPYK